MNQVTVRHETGKLRQEILVGHHHLVADELLELGGEDTGPSPFDLLSSALGVCTAITLRMYAQRKSWPPLRYCQPLPGSQDPGGKDRNRNGSRMTQETV